MRRFWAVVLAAVLALAFFIVGNPAANAFGSEVLGCSIKGATWTANSCTAAGGHGDPVGIQYSPRNLSGAYSMSWIVTDPYGNTITQAAAAP